MAGTSKRTFDCVIVGAGTAGCVMANRLTEDGKRSVLLLEAGPPDSNPWIQVEILCRRRLGAERPLQVAHHASFPTMARDAT